MCMLIANNMQAQVKIGDTTQPFDFSTLELDTKNVKGGLRIPQLNDETSQKLKQYLLASSEDKRKGANGLIIYNTDKRNLFYWDGEDWANSESLNVLYGVNGVSLIDPSTEGAAAGGLKLGGRMEQKTTDINVGDKSLHFPFSENGTVDRFQIVDSISGRKILNVAKDKVSIGSTDEPTRTLVIDNAAGTHEQTLRISNSEEESGALLVSSNYKGDALWRTIRPLSKVIRGKVVSGINIVDNTTSQNNPLITASDASGYLPLTEGQWLIVAKVTTRIPKGEDNTLFLAYLKLLSSKTPLETTFKSNEFKTITSALPSQLPLKTISGTNYCYAMNQLFYFAEVSKGTEYFRLHMSASKPFVTTTDYGENDFYALRIDNIRTLVATDGRLTCMSMPSDVIELKTGESITGNYEGRVNVQVTSGLAFLYAQGSTLSEPDNIGSEHGIHLDVIGSGTTSEEIEGKYYEINPGTGNDRNVSFKVSGTLEDGTVSGYQEVPISIGGVNLTGDNCIVRLFVPTEGKLNSDNMEMPETTETQKILKQEKTHRGRGQNVSFTLTIGLEMTSGSINLTRDQLLAEAYGVSLTSTRDDYNYVARRSYDLSALISGRIADDAPGGTFELVPSLGTVPHGTITPVTKGVKIHVVIAQLESDSQPELPSKAKINMIQPLKVVVDQSSADTYILTKGTVLGKMVSNKTEIKVTYVGENITLTRGTHSLENVQIVSNSVVEKGIYTVNLNNINLYGIAPCDVVINVIDYGVFKPINVELMASENPINTEIIVPLEWVANSISINQGSILGQLTKNGKTYKVEAAESVVIDSPTAATNGVKCILSGPADTAGNTEYVIPLDKITAVGTANVTLKINPIPTPEPEI